MSLLLEALKKAEKAKRSNAPDAPARDTAESPPSADHSLELELPTFKSDDLRLDFHEPAVKGGALPELATTELDHPADSHEQAFPEISLAAMEMPTSQAGAGESAPAPAEAADFMSTTRGEFAPLDFSVTEPRIPHQEPPEEQAAMTVEPTPSAPPAAPETKAEPSLSLDFPEAVTPPPSPRTSEPAPPAAPILAAPREVAPPPVPPAAEQPAAQPTPALPEAADTAKKQEAAKKILAAKQDKPKRNVKLLGGILIAAMIIGAAGAYYFWQALEQLNVAPPQPPMPPAAQSPAQPATVEAEPLATPPAEAQEPPAKASANEEISTGTGSAAQKPPQHETATPAKLVVQKYPEGKPANTERPRETAAARKTSKAPSDSDRASIKLPASGDTAESGIKFRRDAEDTRVDPLLTSAYQAFLAGDIGRAENDYRKALQQTPNNRDALLGLAAIATKRGQVQEAATQYLRVLQLDPRDAAAQAGLIGLRGYADPTLSESRLKTLLAQQPDAGYLHFALGNLYAHQARWSEAQEAYFNALHGDAGNADYAFNLAVSLDHLDQRKPALVYYQRALTLVKERSASFDSEQLKKRIHELQGN